MEQEIADRLSRRVSRLLSSSKLPREKTLETLDQSRLPLEVRQRVRQLCSGDFLDGAVNVCIFGGPGVGKTHLMAAVGRELVLKGRAVLFSRTQSLVERLLMVKRVGWVLLEPILLYTRPVVTVRARHERRSVLAANESRGSTLGSPQPISFHVFGWYDRRHPGFLQKIVTMYSGGMNLRDLWGHIEE